MKLQLGVVRVPYVTAEGQDTVAVANILEDEYRLMQTFFDLHKTEIVDAVGARFKAAMDRTLAGGTKSQAFDMVAAPLSGIEKSFRVYLDKEEMAGTVDGVPTKAAMNGVNSRKKQIYRGKKKEKMGARRASFVDTGAYRGAFRCWIE